MVNSCSDHGPPKAHDNWYQSQQPTPPPPPLRPPAAPPTNPNSSSVLAWPDLLFPSESTPPPAPTGCLFSGEFAWSPSSFLASNPSLFSSFAASSYPSPTYPPFLTSSPPSSYPYPIVSPPDLLSSSLPPSSFAPSVSAPLAHLTSELLASLTEIRDGLRDLKGNLGASVARSEAFLARSEASTPTPSTETAATLPIPKPKAPTRPLPLQSSASPPLFPSHRPSLPSFETATTPLVSQPPRQQTPTPYTDTVATQPIPNSQAPALPQPLQPDQLVIRSPSRQPPLPSFEATTTPLVSLLPPQSSSSPHPPSVRQNVYDVFLLDSTTGDGFEAVPVRREEPGVLKHGSVVTFGPYGLATEVKSVEMPGYFPDLNSFDAWPGHSY